MREIVSPSRNVKCLTQQVDLVIGQLCGQPEMLLSPGRCHGAIFTHRHSQPMDIRVLHG